MLSGWLEEMSSDDELVAHAGHAPEDEEDVNDEAPTENLDPDMLDADGEMGGDEHDLEGEDDAKCFH